jgi:2-keto-4-pentenoate hydratase/2-oxohepta-3-ene-1,7-dioic acid hydratase in catechol pathway
VKYVRYSYKQNVSYGSLKNDAITPLSEAPWGVDCIALDESIPLHNVVLKAPCLPGKVVCIALNYPGITGASAVDQEPLVFLKPSSSVIGPNEKIINPFKGVNVWGESELAIVIGKTLKNVGSIEAKNGIFGYCCANDVSASNLGERDHHLARSKAADTFCVLGPWVDTEFVPKSQTIQGYHNDILLREDKLSARFFKDVDLIKWLSSWMTLEPGDVVLTGAPSRMREREFLQCGDNFRVLIEGLGELSNNYV